MVGVKRKLSCEYAVENQPIRKLCASREGVDQARRARGTQCGLRCGGPGAGCVIATVGECAPGIGVGPLRHRLASIAHFGLAQRDALLASISLRCGSACSSASRVAGCAAVIVTLAWSSV